MHDQQQDHYPEFKDRMGAQELKRVPSAILSPDDEIAFATVRCRKRRKFLVFEFELRKIVKFTVNIGSGALHVTGLHGLYLLVYKPQSLARC